MEIWKPIKGFETKYCVSNLGRLKSLSRIIGNGKGYEIKEKIINPFLGKDGYLIRALCTTNRKKKNFSIHKLVAMTFLSDQLPVGYQVCHKDGDIKNNHVDNLYIGNHITNTLDKYKHGSTKLSVGQILEIRKLLAAGILHRIIAANYGVKENYISRIKTGSRAKFV